MFLLVRNLGLALLLVSTTGQGAAVLNQGISVLEDRRSELTLNEVIRLQDSMRDLPKGTPHLSYSQSTFWLRVPLPQEKSTAEAMLLEINYPLSSVEILYQERTGNWKSVETGEKFPFAERAFHHRNLVVPLPEGAKSPIWVKVNTPTSIQVPLNLYTPQEFTEKSVRHEFYFGLYFGLLGIMLAFNIVMSFLVRDRSTLYYSAFLLSYAMLQLIINRYAGQFFWPHSHWMIYNSAPPALGLTLLCMTLFASHFLHAQAHFPRLNRWMVGSGIAAFVIGASVIVMPYRFAIFGIFVAVPLASLLTLVVSALSIRTGRPALFFFISWTPFVVGLWAIFLKSWGLIPGNFLTTYGIQIGSAIGVLLFSVSLGDRFLKFRAEKERLEKDAAIAKQQAEQSLRLASQAEQVAHDIRSPLTALDVAVSGLMSIPEQERVLIRSAVTRIKDIANHLSQQKIRVTQTAPTQPFDPARIKSQWLWGLIEPVVSEKRLSFHEKGSVKIEAGFSKEVTRLFSRVDAQELKRVLSNLINNSYESFEKSGKITVTLNEMQHHNAIVVEDNGAGIPAHVIPQLMKRGASFGKTGGSGLGLHHAKNAVQSWGGSIDIQSQVGEGTKVTLLIPKGNRPQWSVSEIKIAPEQIPVVVDDDPSIFELWRSRLNGLGCPPPIHFSTPHAFRSWYQNVRNDDLVIFCDFEFKTSPNGLELIKELGITQRCFLVTSRYEDTDVQEACLNLNICLIPKPMAALIQVMALNQVQTESAK